MRRDQPKNLSNSQFKVLQSLTSYDHLVIKASDKGGNVVILDRAHYKEMCLRLLNNKTWYKQISPLVIDNFVKQYYHILDQAYDANIINSKIWEHLRTPFPCTPTLYSLPKTHKDTSELTGRPIVSGNGSLTENGSKYVDTFLRPHVETLFSYVKDTIAFL